MPVYLMRHAEAADTAPAGGDGQRPLTALGERQARAVGAALAAAGERPALILFSPLVRTRQTAALVAELVGGRLEEWDMLRPGADAESTVAALGERADEGSVMLVGHQPDMGALLACCVRHPVAWPFAKGAVAKVEHGALRWWLTPRLAGA